jgi:hypothetical protein
MEKMQAKIEFILKAGAIMILLLVILSNSYIYCYYELFNVSIYDYVKPVDVLALFLPYCFLLVAIMTAIIAIPFYIASGLEIFFKIGTRRKKKDFKAVRIRFRRLRAIFGASEILLFTGFICLVYIEVRHKDLKSPPTDTTASLILAYVSIDLLFLMYYVSAFWARKSKYLKYLLYSLYPLCYLMFILSAALYNANKVKNPSRDPNNEIIKFTFKDATLKTSDSLRYVGSPGESIIFYTSNKKTIIYRKSDLIGPIEIQYVQ